MSEDLAEAQDASEGIEPADLKVSFFFQKKSSVFNWFCFLFSKYFHRLFSLL